MNVLPPPPMALSLPGSQPDDHLEVIAERIRGRIRRTTLDIIDTGNDLLAVKARLEHGDFLAWLDRELAMSVRFAQRYMAAAETFGDKSDTVSHLPPSTVYLLAAHSTPEAIKEEVIADIQAGKAIDVQSIEGRIKIERSIRGRANRLTRSRRSRREARSPAVQKRRAAEALRWQAEMEAVAHKNAQDAEKAVAILKALPVADLVRLHSLLSSPGVFRDFIDLLSQRLPETPVQRIGREMSTA